MVGAASRLGPGEILRLFVGAYDVRHLQTSYRRRTRRRRLLDGGDRSSDRRSVPDRSARLGATARSGGRRRHGGSAGLGRVADLGTPRQASRRSEELRGGNESVRTCRTWGVAVHEKKKKK